MLEVGLIVGAESILLVAADKEGTDNRLDDQQECYFREHYVSRYK